MTCRLRRHPAKTASVTRIAPPPAQIIARLAAMRRTLAAVEETASAALNTADLLGREIRRLENLARQAGAPVRPHPTVAGVMTLVDADDRGGAA